MFIMVDVSLPTSYLPDSVIRGKSIRNRRRRDTAPLIILKTGFKNCRRRHPPAPSLGGNGKLVTELEALYGREIIYSNFLDGTKVAGLYGTWIGLKRKRTSINTGDWLLWVKSRWRGLSWKSCCGKLENWIIKSEYHFSDKLRYQK